MSSSLWPHGLYPARLLCPWNSPDKNAGVGCHSFLQGIFPTQGLNSGLLHCRQIFFLPSELPGKLILITMYLIACSFSIKWVFSRFLLTEYIKFTSSYCYNKGGKMVSFIHNPDNVRKRAPGIRTSECRSKPGCGKLQSTGQSLHFQIL